MVGIVINGLQRAKSLIKAIQLMLYREIIAFFSQIHTKRINTRCRQNVELLSVKLVVRIVINGLQRAKSLIKTIQLMLYREIIACCSQIHTKHTNTLSGQNIELLDVKLMVHIVTTRF